MEPIDTMTKALEKEYGKEVLEGMFNAWRKEAEIIAANERENYVRDKVLQQFVLIKKEVKQ